ncbi:MAG: DegT/DnrJ/EryC1/StrS family aminotransferase [Bryobacterales bacterium]|nr:DegT/DnrJ/EryC1/StrS family aminotransferase [Bryobacterales bacterium]
MQIPMVNFGALLAATKPAWEAHLARLFEKQQFILGEQNANFEQELAQDFGARYAVTVGTGTAAIELSLRAAGITGGDREVIVPALTAPFTGIAVTAAGAALRFADVNPETLLLDVDDLRERVTRRTAAIVPVHLYGQPCDLAALRAAARQAGAVLIQDACQAHGARYRERPLTNYSPYTAYSFYPTKNLGALGDGGAILTNSKKIARELQMLRDGGRRGGQIAYIKGTNSRLDEMQACYLRAFLPELEKWNSRRVRLAALYEQALAGIDAIRPVATSEESVRHLYVVRARKRDQLREYLSKHGIATGIHYPTPLHLMPAFRDSGMRRGSLPHAERAAREIVSLPLWPLMNESAVEQVAGRIRKFYAS